MPLRYVSRSLERGGVTARRTDAIGIVRIYKRRTARGAGNGGFGCGLAADYGGRGRRATEGVGEGREVSLLELWVYVNGTSMAGRAGKSTFGELPGHGCGCRLWAV
jgi:hypothetical protein